MSAALAYCEAYGRNCKQNKEEPVGAIVQWMERFVEQGMDPDTFRFNGNSKELFDRRIDDIRCTSLISPLIGSKFLRILDLSVNTIGDAGALVIAEYLKKDQHLQSLNLSGNNIGVAGSVAIAKAVHSSESLRGLDLSRNNIGEEGGIELAAMLQVNTHLAYLNISGASVTAPGLIALFTVLQANATLRYFLASDCTSHFAIKSASLFGDVIQHVQKALRLNTGLLHLSLGKFGIRDEHTVLLSYALKANHTLVELVLSRNHIMVDGAKALAAALHQHPSLAIFDMSGNEILDGGAQAFSDMLRENTKLRILYMAHNKIANAGLCALAKSVTSANTTLQLLSLWGNHWDAHANATWSKLIPSRFAQDNLDVSFFKPSSAGAQVDGRHADEYEVAEAPSVTLAFGPGTLRNEDASLSRNKNLLPLQHNDLFIGCVTPRTVENLQRTHLTSYLEHQKHPEFASPEQIVYCPWVFLTGVSGMASVGVAKEKALLRAMNESSAPQK